jgi:hypothetical protein
MISLMKKEDGIFLEVTAGTVTTLIRIEPKSPMCIQTLDSELRGQSTKYCWLNVADGKFSESWSHREHIIMPQNLLDTPEHKTFKLIKFECLNDPKFQFTDDMRLA